MVIFKLLLFFIFPHTYNFQKTSFVFPEYPYKETNKNIIQDDWYSSLRDLSNLDSNSHWNLIMKCYEMTFREYEAACEQNPACSLKKSLARLKCIRECISPICYQQIYYQDQLEDGEIDVRLNSFKGCFAMKGGRQR